MNQQDCDFFAQNGFLNLGQLLDATEVAYFHDLFEQDRKAYPYFWHPYGHRHRPYFANDSAIPATLWRDHPDAETRGFYGVLNERTRTLMAAFG